MRVSALSTKPLPLLKVDNSIQKIKTDPERVLVRFKMTGLSRFLSEKSCKKKKFGLFWISSFYHAAIESYLNKFMLLYEMLVIARHLAHVASLASLRILVNVTKSFAIR